MSNKAYSHLVSIAESFDDKYKIEAHKNGHQILGVPLCVFRNEGGYIKGTSGYRLSIGTTKFDCGFEFSPTGELRSAWVGDDYKIFFNDEKLEEMRREKIIESIKILSSLL